MIEKWRQVLDKRGRRRDHPFIKGAKHSNVIAISSSRIRTRACLYQGVRMTIFQNILIPNSHTYESL